VTRSLANQHDWALDSKTVSITLVVRVDILNTMTINKAKTLGSRLIQESDRAHGSKPVERFVPVVDVQKNRKPDAFKEKTKVGPKFFESLPPKELDRWE